MKSILIVLALFAAINVTEVAAAERFSFENRTELIKQSKREKLAKKNQRKVKRHNKQISKNAKSRVKNVKRSRKHTRYYASNHRKISSNQLFKRPIKSIISKPINKVKVKLN